MIKLWEPAFGIIFYEINLFKIAIKHVLFSYPIQVNDNLLPTRVFTSFRIKMVVFRMLMICDTVFELVYTIHVLFSLLVKKILILYSHMSSVLSLGLYFL